MFLRHYPRLVRLATQFTGDGDEARDIVADVMETAWRRHAGMKECSLGAWLYRCVRNACLNRLRHIKVENCHIADLIEATKAATDDDYLRRERLLTYVEAVAGSTGIPLWGYSGTLINSENGESLFSARLDYVTENYPTLMGMTLLRGRVPRGGQDEVMVNEEFARRMGWTADNAIGQVVRTMGETPKVVGVVKDFQIQSYYLPRMPYLCFGMRFPSAYLTFRLKEPFGDNLQKLQKAVAEAWPGRTVDIHSMPQIRDRMYNPVRVFRNATLVAGLVMFVIMLMGLLGYTADEVQRRSKEIAIRKVNGAEAGGILELLGRDVLTVAAPAVLVGILASAYVNGLWLDMFSTQVPAGWPMYALTGIALLLLIVACVLWRTWGIANANPVESIKAE